MTKKYYLEHRKEILKQQSEYNAAHREERAEYLRAHRGEIAKTRAEYLIAHREEIVKQRAIRYAAHREELLKQIAEYDAAHRKERAEYNAEYRATHRAEQAWYMMHQRCDNPVGRSKTYKGVTVCRRWSGPKGQANFITDMGQPPKGTTLSRFGDIGNYKPSNCAWHTRAQQAEEAAKKRLRMKAGTSNDLKDSTR